MKTKLFLLLLTVAYAPAFAQIGGYAGPQILSRPGNLGDRAGAPSGFQFFAGVQGTYETGIIPAATDVQGKVLAPNALIGVIADIGAYGRRSWRRTTIGLDYSGNFRHYTLSSYDGSDHMLGLQVLTQITRHVQLNWRTSAGTISRYYVAGPVSAADLLSSPTNAIFDNRAYYLETGAGFTYQWNARLSFSGQGTGFFVRRQSKALVGLNGYSAQGSLDYRLSRTRTAEASYSFTHFDYPRGFGESDVYTYMGGLSQALGRRWELGVSGGASKISTIGLTQVATDPITAALFGIPFTVEAFSKSIYVGVGRADLRAKYKQSHVSIYYTQLPSAGNGVYLTSKSSTGGATYTYSGIRRASLFLGTNYNRLTSLGQQNLGTFTYVSGGGGASYKLLPSLEATGQFDARNVQIQQPGGFARLSYRIAFGFNFHPGEMPITLW